MTPEIFAQNEYKDYLTYRELARIEVIPDFKKILNELIDHELGDYKFWLTLSSKKEFRVGPLYLFAVRLMRRVLGLTFTAKFIERNERQAIANYAEYAKTASPEVRKTVEDIIEHEKYHEKEMIKRIKEERVEFISNVILGLNDGLIELTGALVGFASAFQNPLTVAFTGSITGIAATLSMASSAYLQAAHRNENAKKAALYTGVSYFAVVLLLVLPFAMLRDLSSALVTMGFVILLIILSISYYTSIIFGRSFKKQFSEMSLFSMGVAAVAFLIVTVFRRATGIEI